MGKMPLAGLIGACSLGIFLTGCNGLNKRPSYAGGRAESSMGLMSGGRRSQSTSIPAPLEDTAGKSSGSPSSTVSPTEFVPHGSSAGSGSAGSGSASSASMTTPSSPGNMTPMSGPTPMSSAKTSSPSPLSSSMNNGNSVSQTPNGGGSNQSSSSPIGQVGHQVDTTYPSSDADGTPYLPSKGPSRVIPPPPVTDNSYTLPPTGKISSSSSSTAPKTTANSGSSKQTPSSSPLPPPPLPSDSTSLSQPPPSVGSQSTSSTPSSGSAKSTNSTSLMLPDYMKN
jgi:hypothetical protein